MKTATKGKSIIIEGNLHERVKTYCNKKNLKIGGLIEKLIKDFLDLKGG